MRTHLKVFYSKNQTIRAQVTKIYESYENETNTKEEFTVGGTLWDSGKFDYLKERIKDKVLKMIDNLHLLRITHLNNPINEKRNND